MNSSIKIIIGIAVLFLIISFSGFETVDTGYRGVKVRFGEVVSESLPEGIYFYNPLTTSIEEMDVKTKRFDSKTSAYTKDIQQAKIDYAINFRLKSDSAHIVYKSVGVDWQDKVLPQIIEGSIKSIVGKWEAVELIENRQQAMQSIFDTITTKLSNRNVIVENFELTNIDYSGDFEKAVEAKVTAIQRASEAKNKTVQIQEEAKQKLIAAKAEAESMKIRSQALSQNKSLVEYEAVQKWDGKLPVTMLGNGTVPFINMTK